MTTNITKLLAICTEYAVHNGLCGPQDRYYIQNRLLALFELDSPYQGEIGPLPANVAPVLAQITDYAAQHGMLKVDTPIFREMFDNQVAGAMLMSPSEVANRFEDINDHLGIEIATQWFYRFCQASNYIRTAEIARNIKYTAPSDYGEVEVTINLTKPEKDPKEIAMALAAPSSLYPACQLCIQNVGYAGRVNHPPRVLLRTIPITLNQEKWHFQYSPYVYFNEHCIALSEAHVPMEINEATYRRLVDFSQQFPHYFIGSNAGLPIAGGSILSHLHFQGGRYTLPMMKAGVRTELCIPLPGVQMSTLKWPMPAIRLSGQDADALIQAATRITEAWETYSDAELGIYANTKGEDHNTITPILHRENGNMLLDLVLRNNLTSAEFPLGIFHPHPERHHIKKENIGLIEVMGLFILPGRLKEELEQTANYLAGLPYTADKVQTHMSWADGFKSKYTITDKSTATAALQGELAVLCMQLLSDAAVFKDTPAGNQGLHRFISSVDFNKEN